MPDLLNAKDLDWAENEPRAEFSCSFLVGRVGPLADMKCAFEHHTAVMAYVVQLAWGQGWTRGILSGRPRHEAVELIGSRVRAAAARSGSFQEWAVSLLVDVGGRLEALRTEDMLWWRRQSQLLAESSWRAMRRREHVEEVIAAWILLREVLHEARDANRSDREDRG